MDRGVFSSTEYDRQSPGFLNATCQHRRSHDEARQSTPSPPKTTREHNKTCRNIVWCKCRLRTGPHDSQEVDNCLALVSL